MKVLVLFVLAVAGTSFSTGMPSKKSDTSAAFGRALREEFLLNKGFVQLNHGAYGTYPKAVQASLRAFQSRAEGNAELWIRRDVRKEMQYVRTQLAVLVNAAAEDIVVVPNTTSGINAVFRSLVFQQGDKILHFSTVYNSMKKLIDYISDFSDGKVSSVEFNVQYPISNDEIVARFEAFLDATPGIRLALVDHISSSPAVILPIERLIPMLKSRGILVLIDGAHAIGQIPVDLTALAPDFYITNAHKWLFAARGAAVLYVDKKHQSLIHPATIASPYTNPANFQEEFFYVGTIDYTPYMTVTAALQYRRGLGGEAAIIEYTHGLAVEGGSLMANQFGTRILQADDQLANMVDVQLPLNNPDDPRLTADYWIDIQLNRTNIFVAIYKHNGYWWARTSAQVYTDITDFQLAADVLGSLCADLNAGVY